MHNDANVSREPLWALLSGKRQLLGRKIPQHNSPVAQGYIKIAKENLMAI